MTKKVCLEVVEFYGKLNLTSPSRQSLGKSIFLEVIGIAQEMGLDSEF